MFCMNKTLALLPLMVAIFALMLSPAVMSVSADKGGNDKAKGEPKGCGNDKGQDAIQNPNCDSTGNATDTDGDGIDDIHDLCPNNPVGSGPQTNSDNDGDGVDNVDDSAPCDALVQ